MLSLLAVMGSAEGPRVQHGLELDEGESPGIQATPERAERLANLIALSHEPMFAWRLDGPIELWNAEPSNSMGFRRAMRLATVVMRSCKQNSPLNLPSYVRVCRIHVTGRANFVTFARTDTRFL